MYPLGSMGNVGTFNTRKDSFTKEGKDLVMYIDCPGIPKPNVDLKFEAGKYLLTVHGANQIGTRKYNIDESFVISKDTITKTKEIKVKTVYGVTVVTFILEDIKPEIPKVSFC